MQPVFKLQIAQVLALIIASVLFLATPAVHASDPLPESWKVYEEKYPAISIEKLSKALDKNEAFLIDANNTDTFRKGHIPRALSLTDLMDNKKANQLPANHKKLIIVYCGGPQCASWHKAADYASLKGYKNIKHFKGGLKEWKAKNRTLEALIQEK